MPHGTSLIALLERSSHRRSAALASTSPATLPVEVVEQREAATAEAYVEAIEEHDDMVRLQLLLDHGSPASAVLSRSHAAWLDLEVREIVYVRLDPLYAVEL